MIDLIAAGTLQGPQGPIDLMPADRRYKVEASSLDSRQVTHRKQEATNPYVEGSYVVHAVRENIVENVSIYCYGDGQASCAELVQALTDAFDQLYYQLSLTTGDRTVTWDCLVADYQVLTSQPLLVAKMALVKAQVPRRPQASVTVVPIPSGLGPVTNLTLANDDVGDQ